jgi:hypothetical protein
VPADPSSSIPSGLTALGHAEPLRPAETPHLLAYLTTVTDPRTRSGRRHPLVAILMLAAAAVLAGARWIAAIAEWAADAPSPCVPRSEPAAIPAPATGCGRSPAKLRGSGGQGRQVHPLAAMDQATRAVLAQRHVNGAPGEVPGLRPLLADLDLAGVVVTADALHTRPDAAEFLVAGKQAHYLLSSRPTSPPCWRAAPAWPGIASRSWTGPATAATAASSCAPSRPSPCTISGSRTPPRSSRPPAEPASLGPAGGGP